MMDEETIPDVPDEQLHIVMSDLKFEKLEVQQAIRQPNGSWTLKVRPAPAPKADDKPPPKEKAVVVPADWMPNCAMERIICHWTAGAYRAGDHDRECYHILVEGDGTLVRGDHSIADNVDTRDRDYAAHTLSCNSRSIGISVCCMANAIEGPPLKGGPCPMTPLQWDVLAQVAAQLAKRYRIAVTPRTVLGHGEVQDLLGIKQKQKWDPMVLPWEPTTPKRVVGDRFRTRVSELVAKG
jgi:hypothetical protein